MRSDYCPVANEPCQCMCLGDCRLRKGVRYAAMETELTECKAAYESQFKELHAVKAELKAIKEAEPVAWLVLSVNPDGSTSVEYAAEWAEAAHEHINDAITEYGNTEAGSWIVRPVYTLEGKS